MHVSARIIQYWDITSDVVDEYESGVEYEVSLVNKGCDR